MKKMYYLGLSLLLSASLLTSCNKEDAAPKLSKTEMLAGKTEKKWKITDYTLNGQSFGVDDCEKDDIFTFKHDKNFSYSFGTNDCEGENTNYTGKWSLSADESKLTMPEDGVDVIYAIKELSATTLKVEYDFFGMKTGATYKSL